MRSSMCLPKVALTAGQHALDWGTDLVVVDFTREGTDSGDDGEGIDAHHIPTPDVIRDDARIGTRRIR